MLYAGCICLVYIVCIYIYIYASLHIHIFECWNSSSIWGFRSKMNTWRVHADIVPWGRSTGELVGGCFGDLLNLGICLLEHVLWHWNCIFLTLQWSNGACSNYVPALSSWCTLGLLDDMRTIHVIHPQHGKLCSEKKILCLLSSRWPSHEIQTNHVDFSLIPAVHTIVKSPVVDVFGGESLTALVNLWPKVDPHGHLTTQGVPEGTASLGPPDQWF